jgi:hypothetical protein
MPPLPVRPGSPRGLLEERHQDPVRGQPSSEHLPHAEVDAPASKPAPRSERRAALYSEVQAVAEKLEKFGTSEGDTEVRLLALIVRHGAYQLQTTHGFPENRARRLRDLAEVAAPHVIDKWWRTKEDQAAARAGTVLNEGSQSRWTSRAN